MTLHPVNPSTVVSALDLLKSYGPNLAGWVVAMAFFCIVGWFIVRSAVIQVRSVKSVLDMGEELRVSMKSEKEKCEEECRRKDAIIHQLMEQHSKAREVFFQEARERDEVHRASVNEERRLRDELAMLTRTVHGLNEQLEAARNAKRRTDRD